jgi:hypothetical protein
MFAAKSLTMKERGREELADPTLALVAMGATNDQIWRFALSAAAGGFILFRFGASGRYRTSPRMSLTASMFGRAMARAFSAPSARTLFV